jgi:hypothetical protein
MVVGAMFVAVVGGALSATPPAGAASVPRVLVVAPTPPAVAAGHEIQIPVYSRNLGADLFCSTSIVRVRWSDGQRTWARTRSDGSAIQGETTMMRIPARYVVPGILHYVVTVDQECGLFLWPPNGVQWFSGRWPSTGAAHVVVVAA